MKRKPVMGFARKNESEQLSSTAHILLCMTDNPNFPTPDPPLSEIQATYDEYAASRASWERGNARKTLEKNKKKQTLTGRMGKLRNYVDLTADGDADKILSSGFGISKGQREIQPIPAAPLISEIQDGTHSGSVVVLVKGGITGHIFSVSYRPEDETNGKVEFGKTRHSVSISGLQAGKYYIFRAAISNSAGTSEWSPEMRFLVR